MLLGEVLRREVVELVLAADRDLGDHAGIGRVGAEALDHAALDLAAAVCRGLHQHLGVVHAGLLDGRVELVGVVDLADPDARAAPAGLDEDRVAQGVDRLEAGRPVGLPGPRGHHRVGQHRQALRLEDDLHVVLVHADRRGEHAGTDVAHPGHLQQTLDGAVLAPRAVQQREDHVDLAEGAAARRWARARRARCRRTRSASVTVARVGSTSGSLSPVVIASRSGSPDSQHPAAVVGDADRDHVVAVGVDRAEARCRRSSTRRSARWTDRRRRPRCAACGSGGPAGSSCRSGSSVVMVDRPYPRGCGRARLGWRHVRPA